MLASAEIKKVDSKQRMSKISSLWKDLSDADKKKYQERVIHVSKNIFFDLFNSLARGILFEHVRHLFVNRCER